MEMPTSTQFSLQQVSVFYLFLVAVMAYYGFTKSAQIGAHLGREIGDAAGAVMGALVAIAVSYTLFMKVRSRGMIAQ